MKNNLMIRYLRDSWLELKKVKWPTRKEVASSTVIVIIAVMVAIAFTASVDFGLSRLVEYLVQRG